MNASSSIVVIESGKNTRDKCVFSKAFSEMTSTPFGIVYSPRFIGGQQRRVRPSPEYKTPLCVCAPRQPFSTTNFFNFGISAKASFSMWLTFLGIIIDSTVQYLSHEFKTSPSGSGSGDQGLIQYGATVCMLSGNVISSMQSPGIYFFKTPFSIIVM